MHAVIVGVSDETYARLLALSQDRIDHSWLATHLLEAAVREAPEPRSCQGCGQTFFVPGVKTGSPFRYCSDACREAGAKARKRRWWRKQGRAWRAQQSPRRARA